MCVIVDRFSKAIQPTIDGRYDITFSVTRTGDFSCRSAIAKIFSCLEIFPGYLPDQLPWSPSSCLRKT